MSKIDEVLDTFAKWTIQNVEHGIYVPLPSPEAKQQLYQLILDEVIGEDDDILRRPTFEKAQDEIRIRDNLRAEQRAKLHKLFNGEEE